ncbi:hypothetical protein OROGR_029333 [Orobanche gracilis]
MAVSQARDLGLPIINLLRLKGVPILQQLHLEERLLRISSDNWCIINDGTIDPTIVMGTSGKPKELLEIESVLRDDIPVVRRFTGGGTVIVDQGTVFVTFICNKDAVSGLQSYPQPIMSWSSLLYKKVFQGIGDFNLRENDYVLSNRKFGGNAQSITKNRWVHHTSFLWDYEISNMGYLKLPKRAPEYRQAAITLDGTNPLSCIARVNQYFLVHHTLEGSKVGLALITKIIDRGFHVFLDFSLYYDDVLGSLRDALPFRLLIKKALALTTTTLTCFITRRQLNRIVPAMSTVILTGTMPSQKMKTLDFTLLSLKMSTLHHTVTSLNPAMFTRTVPVGIRHSTTTVSIVFRFFPFLHGRRTVAIKQNLRFDHDGPRMLRYLEMFTHNVPVRTKTLYDDLARDHLEFICRMKDYFISRSDFIDRTIEAVGSQFLLKSSELEGVQCSLASKFEPSSGLLTRQELDRAVFESSPRPLTASRSI